MAINIGGVVEGGACVVTEGPNAGKTGTYTIDEEGNVWCEGPWGGTQCATSKCRDGLTELTVFDYEDDDGQFVYETDGLFEVTGVGVFRCRARIDASTGESRIVEAIPIPVHSLAELRRSESDVTRNLASVIESHLETRSRD
jgi:hypothetical protein